MKFMASTQLKDQVGSSPQVGIRMKSNWNHHLATLGVVTVPLAPLAWLNRLLFVIRISGPTHRDANVRGLQFLGTAVLGELPAFGLSVEKPAQPLNFPLVLQDLGIRKLLTNCWPFSQSTKTETWKMDCTFLDLIPFGRIPRLWWFVL